MRLRSILWVSFISIIVSVASSASFNSTFTRDIFFLSKSEDHLNTTPIRASSAGNQSSRQLSIVNGIIESYKELPPWPWSIRIPSLPKPTWPDLSALRQLFDTGKRNVQTTAICNACRLGFAWFLLKARSGIGFPELQKLAIRGCTTFKITSSMMCTGLIDLYAPILRYIAIQRPMLTPDRFCGSVLQSYGCLTSSTEENDWNLETSVALPSQKGIWTDFHRKDSNSNATGGRILKILHLADIHVDPDYVVGSNAACTEELCCRGDIPEIGAVGAGFYGDLRKCDLPYHTFQNALEHISKTHKDLDLIYMTGDLVPHDGWVTDTGVNVGILRKVAQMLKTYFPHTRIIPALGNHESRPMNMFPPLDIPSKFSVHWLYESAAEAWIDWIPAESMESFLQYGYYHVPVIPGFRVIVLNTNVCYGYNFWILYDAKDPGNQLKWLAAVLQRSQELGEKVHLVGHVPPGQDECAATWSRNFHQIVYKFRAIIQSQFYGHTHMDEFQVMYDQVEKGVVVSSIWMGPSLSPFKNLNPGYKVYHMDGGRKENSTWNVLDFETWTFNLALANIRSSDSVFGPTLSPEWFQLYRASKAYHLPNLLPTSLHTLVQRLTTDPSWFNIYYKYYFKATEASLNEDCDDACRKRISCNLVIRHPNQGHANCIRIENRVADVVDKLRIQLLDTLASVTKLVGF